jgi:hypothetical protein
VGLAAGIHDAFVFSVIIMCVGFLAIFFLKEIPLRGVGSRKSAVQATEDGLEKAGETVNPVVMH